MDKLTPPQVTPEILNQEQKIAKFATTFTDEEKKQYNTFLSNTKGILFDYSYGSGKFDIKGGTGQYDGKTLYIFGATQACNGEDAAQIMRTINKIINYRSGWFADSLTQVLANWFVSTDTNSFIIKNGNIVRQGNWRDINVYTGPLLSPEVKEGIVKSMNDSYNSASSKATSSSKDRSAARSIVDKWV